MKVALIALGIASALAGEATHPHPEEGAQTADGAATQQPAEAEKPDGYDELTPGQQAVVDTVLEVENVTVLPDLLTQNAAVIDPVAGDEDGYTIFAPNDAALNGVAASADVLSYHVSTNATDLTALPAVVRTTHNSEGLEGAAQVVVVKQEGEGTVVSYGLGSVTIPAPGDGPVQVVDGIMQLPIGAVQTLQAVTGLQVSQAVTLISQSGLVEEVNSAQGVTIFIPTNDAFDAAGDIAASDVANIIKHHVVKTALYSPEMESGAYETLNGSTVNINVTDEGVKVGDANVVAADIITDNGVIHVIDSVLVPAADENEGGEVASAAHSLTNVASGFIAAATVAIMSML